MAQGGTSTEVVAFTRGLLTWGSALVMELRRCLMGCGVRVSCGVEIERCIGQWRNGDHYDGCWLRDFMHGEGLYTAVHGTRIQGLFSAGDVIAVSQARGFVCTLCHSSCQRAN